jgi:hypothetical protein
MYSSIERRAAGEARTYPRQSGPDPPFGSCDRDPDGAAPHFEECVAEIGLEFLSNPNDCLMVAAKRPRELVNPRDEPRVGELKGSGADGRNRSACRSRAAPIEHSPSALVSRPAM